MPVAVFSGKTFQVSSKKIYTFNDLNLSSSLNVESQDVEGKKPSTYVKGPGLNAMGFSIPVKISLGYYPLAEYESWEAIKDKTIAYPFILGGKPIGVNKWLLKSVSLNNTTADNKGTILSGVIQLEFEEYIRPGSKSNSSNGSSPGVSSGSGVKYTVILPKDKESQKRNNTNVTAAVKRPLIYKNIANI